MSELGEDQPQVAGDGDATIDMYRHVESGFDPFEKAWLDLKLHCLVGNYALCKTWMCRYVAARES